MVVSSEVCFRPFCH